jgi:tRNA(Phe) wybutosine-synthesizing methylase Tyw3
MLDSIKELAISKGMQLLNSPVVTKAMESEQVGTIIEKAMSVPVKVSEAIRTRKEQLTSFMEVATQSDLDEVKRNLARMEDELSSMKSKSDQ